LQRSSAKTFKVKADRKESVESQTAAEDIEDVPFRNLFNEESYSDSQKAAKDLFALMIKPLDTESFFR